MEDWHVENVTGMNFGTVRVENPLYNDVQNSYNQAKGFGVRDNFSIEIRPIDVLSIRGRVGLTKSYSESEYSLLRMRLNLTKPTRYLKELIIIPTATC